MTRLRTFVKDELTKAERDAIIQSYEQYEQDGFIGGEPIRTYARKFVESLGITHDYQITLWMEKLAMECYRYYYHSRG
jgi:hypothetical protein